MTPVVLSLYVGLACAVLGLPLALPLGHLLARRHFVGKSLVSTLIALPLVLPPVVTGYLLLTMFQGIAFRREAAVLAALVVGLPLYVSSVRLAIEAVDVRYEEVSRTLGYSAWQTWWRVTFPLALPGIAGGFVLTFARALGEFGATAVLAGNVEGETQTLALAVYALLDAPDGETRAAPLVWLSVALAFVALLGYEWLSRWQRRRMHHA